jgi:hypothetical protein
MLKSQGVLWASTRDKRNFPIDFINFGQNI